MGGYVQDLGYVIVDNEIILVLFRSRPRGRTLKLRSSQSGERGQYLEDESYFLEDNPDYVEKLLNGGVITL